MRHSKNLRLIQTSRADFKVAVEVADNALLNGAFAAITGNMLTTPNNNIKADMKLLHDLGLTNH